MTQVRKQARASAKNPVYYHLCSRCGRATPAAAKEQFCPNDGNKLLSCCPSCGSSISSPYSRFCSHCGQSFSPTESPKEKS